MKRLFAFLLVLLIGWLFSEMAFAQAPDTLFISTSQVVHLRFSSELKYVNLGSRDIVAKIVDGSKDFVAVKAREPFSSVTSMSCLESNGAMHTFFVAYREHPSRLDIDTRFPAAATEVAETDYSFSPQSSPRDSRTPPIAFEDVVKMKQELYHLGTRSYDIDVQCENIFVKDDVLFLLISLKNNSAVSYNLTAPRFSIESKRRTKRGLQYEKAAFPRNSYGLGIIQPDETRKLVFTFDKIALTKGQVFRVYFYENGGGRNLTLTLNINDVNKAMRM